MLSSSHLTLSAKISTSAVGSSKNSESDSSNDAADRSCHQKLGSKDKKTRYNTLNVPYSAAVEDKEAECLKQAIRDYCKVSSLSIW